MLSEFNNRNETKKYKNECKNYNHNKKKLKNVLVINYSEE